MSRGKASGYTLDYDDVPIILGMVARGDRDHDIAAWFGVNQGRIAEAKEGKYGRAEPADGQLLPPKGPPGMKGRNLREAIDRIIELLAQDDPDIDKVRSLLIFARKKYDRNET